MSLFELWFSRYHLTPVRMVIIKKSRNNKCWKECGEKGTLPHCWWECKLIQPLWKTVWRFLTKLKIELPYDPAIPLLCLYIISDVSLLVYRNTTDSVSSSFTDSVNYNSFLAESIRFSIHKVIHVQITTFLLSS